MEQDSNTEIPIKQMASNKKTGVLSKIFRSEKTYLTILIVSTIIIVFDFARMLLYDDQKNIWLFILAHTALIIIIALAIIQLLRLKRISRKPASPTPQWSSKFRSNSAIISLICSPIPLIFITGCLIVFGDSINKPGGGDVFALMLALYYMIIGFLVFLLWLVCGIIGLRTSKRKLAIISLTLRPVGFLIIAIVMAILWH